MIMIIIICMIINIVGAAIFDMEYARWLEDDHRLMSELRTGLHAHLSDGDLRLIIDGYVSHYDEIFRLKGVAAKSDVFHLFTGMWVTPAERCFFWIGGFRPSELIKVWIHFLLYSIFYVWSAFLFQLNILHVG